MERLTLSAVPREPGKKGLGVLRQKGFVPAILYGQGAKPRGLTLNARELGRALGSSAGMNAIIELNIESEKKPEIVMIKDFQVHVLTHKIIHTDLLKIDIKAKVTVKVPIHVTGKAVGVVNGGVLEQIMRELELQCLPTHIPSSIEVDITPLEIGHSLHLKDLKLPEGVEVEQDANLTIVSVAAPRAEEPVATAETSAAEVPVVGKEKEEGEAEEEGAKKKEASKPESGKPGAGKAEKK